MMMNADRDNEDNSNVERRDSRKRGKSSSPEREKKKKKIGRKLWEEEVDDIDSDDDYVEETSTTSSDPPVIREKTTVKHQYVDGRRLKKITTRSTRKIVTSHTNTNRRTKITRSNVNFKTTDREVEDTSTVEEEFEPFDDADGTQGVGSVGSFASEEQIGEDIDGFADLLENYQEDDVGGNQGRGEACDDEPKQARADECVKGSKFVSIDDGDIGHFDVPLVICGDESIATNNVLEQNLALGGGIGEPAIPSYMKQASYITIRDEMNSSFGIFYADARRDDHVPNFVTRAMEALKFVLLYQAFLEGCSRNLELPLSIEKTKKLACLRWNSVKKIATVKLLSGIPGLYAKVKSHMTVHYLRHSYRLKRDGVVPIHFQPMVRLRELLTDGFLIVSVLEQFGFKSVSDIETMLKEHGGTMNRTSLFEIARLWGSTDRLDWTDPGESDNTSIAKQEKLKAENAQISEELNDLYAEEWCYERSGLAGMLGERKSASTQEHLDAPKQQSMLMILLTAQRSKKREAAIERSRLFRSNGKHDPNSDVAGPAPPKAKRGRKKRKAVVTVQPEIDTMQRGKFLSKKPSARTQKPKPLASVPPGLELKAQEKDDAAICAPAEANAVGKPKVGDCESNGKQTERLDLLEVPLLSEQIFRGQFDMCLVAEQLYKMEGRPVGTEFCSPEQNVKRLVLVELGAAMLMTMEDSGKTPHGTLPTRAAFDILGKESQAVRDGPQALPLSRTVPVTTFLQKCGQDISAGPIQVVYEGSEMYDKHFGRVRIDLKKLINFLSQQEKKGLRKFSAVYGFNDHNYNTAMRELVLTPPKFTSMGDLSIDLREATAKLLDAMQECMDESIFVVEPVYNNTVRADFVKEYLKTHANIDKARGEGWAWVMTSNRLPLDRHIDSSNCTRKGYAGNCVFSAVTKGITGGNVVEEIVRVSLIVFSRACVGNYVEKIYGYCYELSEYLNVVHGRCGNYESMALLECDCWTDLIVSSESSTRAQHSVLVRQSSPFKEVVSTLSSFATLIRRACLVFPSRRQHVAVFYVACMCGSPSRFWSIVSDWLKGDGALGGGKTPENLSEFDIIGMFWFDMAARGWEDCDSGVGTDVWWCKTGSWQCENEKDAADRVQCLLGILVLAHHQGQTKSLLDGAAKTVVGFDNPSVLARFLPLAVISGILEGRNDRGLDCNERSSSDHFRFLEERNCKATRNQAQFHNAISKKYQLPDSDAARFILLGSEKELTPSFLFKGQDLFLIDGDHKLWVKKWNTCRWRMVSE